MLVSYPPPPSPPPDLSVLDWSKQEQLAIALGNAVYVLDTDKGGITNLCNLDSGPSYISSVQWNRSGKYLAVGTSDAEIQVNRVCNLQLCTHTNSFVPTLYT